MCVCVCVCLMKGLCMWVESSNYSYSPELIVRVLGRSSGHTPSCLSDLIHETPVLLLSNTT